MKKLLSGMMIAVLILCTCLFVSADSPRCEIIPKSEIENAILDVGMSFVKEDTPPPKIAVDAILVADDNDSTAWTASELQGSSVQVNFDEYISFNMIHIKEKSSNCRKFTVEAWNGIEWVKVYNNDLIETYHMGVMDEAIYSKAIRLTINHSVDFVSIKELKVSLQRPVKREAKFNNMAYLMASSFVNNNLPDNLHSYSDIIMHGVFAFNTSGQFVLKIDGMDANSKENTIKMTEWIKNIRNSLSENKDIPIWISLQGHSEGGKLDGWIEKENRTNFIESVMTFVKKHDIAGVDINWEFPSGAAQMRSCEQMVEELGPALHAEGRYLSAAVARWESMSMKPEALNKLDRILIMTYDNKSTDGQHSTFSWSAVAAVKEALNEKGLDKEKVFIGLPYYGTFTADLGQLLAWSSIYNKLTFNNEDDDTSVDKGINTHGGYHANGVYMIRNKVVYAIKNQLGGVFCWSANSDTSYENDGSLAKTTEQTINDYIE